jgi:hypothetical protein
LRLEAVARELGDTRIIALRLLETGLGLGELRLRRHQLRLIGRRIDLEQEIAGLHILAFAKIDLDQEAVDPRPDVDRLHRLDAADIFVGGGNVARRDALDGDRGRRTGRRLSARRQRREQGGEQQRQG